MSVALRTLVFAVLGFGACSPNRPQATSHDAVSLAKAAFNEVASLRTALRRVDDTFVRSEPGTLAFVAPTHFRAPLHLASECAVDIEPLDVADARAELRDHSVVYADVARATDAVTFATNDRVEDLRILHDASAPTTFRFRVRTSACSVRVEGGRIEVVDAQQTVRLATAPLVAADATGTRRALEVSIDGDVVTARLDARALAYPIVVDPVWTAVSNALRFRAACVTTATNGQAVVSCMDGPWLDIYDPTTNAFSAGPDLPFAGGYDQSAIEALKDGTVLFVSPTSTATTRLRMSDKTYVATAAMPTACAGCNLTLLSNGWVMKVPATGTTVEAYKTATNTWSTVAAMPMATGTASKTRATRLADGRLAVLEGASPGRYVEIYDPATNTWSTSVAAPTIHRNSDMVGLANGKVLVAGQVETSGTVPRVAHLYDPSTNTWSSTGNVARFRQKAPMVLLSSGQVLVSGGYEFTTFNVPSSDAEVYDPGSNTWTSVGALDQIHVDWYGTLLLDGSALHVAGFVGSAGLTIWNNGTRYYPNKTGTACTSDVVCMTGVCLTGVCCDKRCDGRCDSPAGTCKISDGKACTVGSDCASGSCVDGVCCNTACTGNCVTCKLPGSVGKCSPFVGAPTLYGRAACGGTGAGTSCGGTCNGVASTCTFPGTTTACGADACTAGVETRVGNCDGAGSCSSKPVSCGTYACGAKSCKTSCTESVDCAPGYFCGGDKCRPKVGLGSECKATSGCNAGLFCVDGVCCGVESCGAGKSCGTPAAKGECRKTEGTTCADGTECGSGFCVDGVCCNAACTGQCEACDLATSKGTCAPVAGAPHGSRAACDTGASLCAARTCDGVTSVTSCAGWSNVGKTCGAQVCSDGKLTPPPTCNESGACVTAESGSCGRYACADGSTCKTGCTIDGDCAKGFVCSAGECRETSVCSTDGNATLGVDGKRTECAPYRCRDGACRTKCETSDDCAGGRACDVATGTCSQPALAPSVDDSGGCSASPTRPTGSALFMLVVLGLLARRGGRR